MRSGTIKPRRIVGRAVETRVTESGETIVIDGGLIPEFETFEDADPTQVVDLSELRHHALSEGHAWDLARFFSHPHRRPPQ
jgi:hypothetical protein